MARLLRLGDALQLEAQPLLLETETRRAAAKLAEGLADHGEVVKLPGGEVRGREPLELYLKEVQLHPVSVRVSVQMGMACDEAELQEWHPTNSLVGLARHLVSLHACNHISTSLELTIFVQAWKRLLPYDRKPVTTPMKACDHMSRYRCTTRSCSSTPCCLRTSLSRAARSERACGGTTRCNCCSAPARHSVQRTAYSVQRTAYSVQRTAHSLHRTAYIVQLTSDT